MDKRTPQELPTNRFGEIVIDLDKDPAEKVADLLHTLIKRTGISHRQLAAAAHLKHPTIGYYLDGRRLPPIDRLALLLRGLGHPAYLVVPPAGGRKAAQAQRDRQVVERLEAFLAEMGDDQAQDKYVSLSQLVETVRKIRDGSE